MDDLINFPGWETRKKIMKELKNGEKNAYELSKTLDLNYSSVRYHLELLQRFGLVKTIKKGRRQYFELTKTGLNLLS